MISSKKYILRALLALFIANLFVLNACEDSEVTPEMEAYFKIRNIDDETELEAPGDLVFVNGSKNGLSYHWDFASAYLKNDPARANTFTGISPDTVHFPLPGTYDITVTVKGSGGLDDEVYTKSLVFKKMTPAISFLPESILKDTLVYFDVSFLRLPGETPTFSWTFEDGEPATSTSENPVVKFLSSGDKAVTLELNDGEEVLMVQTTVPVKRSLAPTLYFTDMATQQIYTKKITDVEGDDVISPTGITLPDGSKPMTVVVDDERVYFTNTSNNLGTATFGEIKSFKWDGTDLKTIIGGGSGQAVPFSLAINGNDLYFTDRRDGIYKINKTVADQTFSGTSRWISNSESVYYGNGFGFGAQNGTVFYRDGKVWWAKNSNWKGLYTLLPTLPRDDNNKVTGEKLLETFAIRAFTIDENTGKIYFFINQVAGVSPIGLYVANIDGSDLTLIEEYAPGTNLDGEGGSAQYLGITGIAVLDDYVYWGYRSSDKAAATSGIKRAKLDGSDVEMFIPGYVPYGIAIDKVPR